MQKQYCQGHWQLVSCGAAWSRPGPQMCPGKGQGHSACILLSSCHVGGGPRLQGNHFCLLSVCCVPGSARLVIGSTSNNTD